MMSWNQAVLGRQVAVEAAAAPAAMDSSQFAAFYERSARSLWAYLVRCSGDPALAEDLMQEAYVRFLGATPPTDGELAARKYLFRIASNLLRDHWRRPKTSSLEELPENFFATCANAEELVAQQHLARAMEELRPRDRQILWLAHAENYSHREIAEIMGLATPSIRILLFRARGRMRQLMEGSR
jgi:RNA polymerase sigma-70 factor, ECF subfamily